MSPRNHIKVARPAFTNRCICCHGAQVLALTANLKRGKSTLQKVD